MGPVSYLIVIFRNGYSKLLLGFGLVIVVVIVVVDAAVFDTW